MLKWRDVIKYASTNSNGAPDKRVEKTEKKWKTMLIEEQFNITRLKGTERAFSSALYCCFETTRYACVCCGRELFDADRKFDSGTGVALFQGAYKRKCSFVLQR